MPPDSTFASTDLRLFDDALAFCRHNDLLGHLGRAVELARRCFTIVGDPVVQLEQDPEVEELYLVLEIRVAEDEDESIEAQRTYSRSWATTTPWPAVHMISLICNLAEE
jgi:hypothetical protein